MSHCLLALSTLLFVVLLLAVFFVVKRQYWPRIIMFHQVDKNLPASGMNMPPAKFEQMIKRLAAKGYQFCTITQLVEKNLNQVNKRKTVALTFDDGFADNFEQMFPLLVKYNAKATIYLATQINTIAKLSHTQIMQMQNSGLVEFGAHTVDHVNLLKLSKEQALEQIAKSKQEVEALTKQPCHSFAYPYGRYNEQHAQMLASLGFLSAVTTHKKIQPITSSNVLKLPRISSSGKMSSWQFELALWLGRYKF